MAAAQVIHSLETGGHPGSVSAAAGADLVKVYNGTVSSAERYTGGYSWGAADGNFGYRRSSQTRLRSQRPRTTNPVLLACLFRLALSNKQAELRRKIRQTYRGKETDT